MSYVLRPLSIIIVFIVAGSTLKFADYLGEISHSIYTYIPAIISGVCFGVLIHVGVDESSYAVGIILGVTLSGKINRLNLLAGLLTIGIVSFLLSWSTPDTLLVFIICILSFVDEICHNNLIDQNNFIKFLIKYRINLKLGTIFMIVFNMISIIAGVGFLCFDLSYDLISKIVE